MDSQIDYDGRSMIITYKIDKEAYIETAKIMRSHTSP